MVDDGTAARSGCQVLLSAATWPSTGSRENLYRGGLCFWRNLGRGSAAERQRVTFRGLSLDVFDTSLTRASGPPLALYLLLGNRLKHRGEISCTPEVFARARAQAEADVWAREGGLDARVRLSDFHRELVRVLDLDSATPDHLLAAELALEAQLLRPIRQAECLLARCDATGARVVFVSDTYFDEAFIAEQLQRHGLWRPGARVISSADHDTSKASGGLFETALDVLELPAEQVVHAGDNPRSDIASASLYNLTPIELPDGRLNRYELLLADRMWASAGLSAVFAGASRLARLSVPVTSSREAAIRDVTAGVAAPFLTSYLLWILRQADEAGLERLYFIARGGQVMADIARWLVRRLDLDLEISYLFASRDSVNFAATFELDEDELALVQRDLPQLTPRELLRRFDLRWQDVASLPCLRYISPDAAEGSDDAHRLFRQLRDSPELRSAALSQAARRRDVVVWYLDQEGLLDGSNCGLVLVGGATSKMRALHSLIVDAGGQPPQMYVVGLDRPDDAELTASSGMLDWLADTRWYLYNHRRGSGTRRARGFDTCVRMFTAADHGTVSGYTIVDDRVAPLLDEQVDQEILDWGLPLMRQAIDAFVEHLVLDGDLVDASADVREAVTSSIDLFWSDPTTAEAMAWGSFPLEGAQTSGRHRFPLAHRYTIWDIVRSVAEGTFPNLGWMHWYEGSLRLSSRLVATPLDIASRVVRRAERSQCQIARRTVPMIRRWIGH